MLNNKSFQKILLCIFAIISCICGYYFSPKITNEMLNFWNNVDELIPFIKYVLLILNFISVSVLTFSSMLLPLVILKRKSS